MNAHAKRPRRQRKGDRLITPGATRQQIECDYAIAPMDRLAVEMDKKWGIDRLPELVTPEMAARYGAAIGYLNECINNEDPEKCAQAAGNCIRGLHAMDAEATRLGQPTASGDYLEFQIEGDPPFKFAILKDGAEWQAAQDARPDLTFYTLREAGIALRAKLSGPGVTAVKDAFPGAHVIDHRTPMGKLIDDEIPW